MLYGLVALACSLSMATGGEVTLSKDSLPAVGTADAVLRVERSGMVRIGVDSPTGTACTLVDHLRGPFVSSGTVGKDNCALDVLLDAGLYKVRLTSPPPGPGTVRAAAKKTAPKQPVARLTATHFTEIGTPEALEPGRSSQVALPPGRQATRWLRITARQEVVIEVAGRTAGRVGLWRDGQWLVDAPPESSVQRPLAGRPVWWHTLKAVVDPGDYALVVYGTEPQRFSVGADDDTAFIGFDAPSASSSRSELVVIPVWGFTAFRAPRGTLAAFLHVEGARTAPVTLVATRVTRDGILRRAGSERCVVPPDDPFPTCSLQSGSTTAEATILRLEGPPGTVARVVWGPVGEEPDSFSSSSSPVFTAPAAFDRVVLASVPVSVDTVPVGCTLEALTTEGGVLATIARDLPDVGWTQAWKRRFNVEGTATTIWLNIAKPGVYSITGDDARAASCEVLQLRDDGSEDRLGEGQDGGCKQRLALPAGPIAIRFYGGTPGIQTLRVGLTGVSALIGNDDDAAQRTGCSLSLPTPRGPGRYRVRSNDPGAARLWALRVWRGAWDGTATTVALDPGRELSLSLAAGASVVVRADGAGVLCALEGLPLPACETGPLMAPATLTLRSRDRVRPVIGIVARAETLAPPPPPPPWQSTPPALPVVAPGRTAWFDLLDDTARVFVVDVAQAGLYDLQSEGRLSTRCSVRTATSAELFVGDANGRGHNCLVQAYLKPGRYLVQVNRNGNSSGRAGLSLVARTAWDGGELVVGDERYVMVEPATLAHHRFTLKNDTTLRGGVTAQGAALSCRLDDDDGWPVKAVPHDCALADEALPAGRYTLNVLPLTVESRRALRLGEPPTDPLLTGETIHTLALNRPYRAVLSADGIDEFRFMLAGDATVGVVLGDGIQGRLYRLADDGSGARGDVVATIEPRGGSAFTVEAVAADEGGGAQEEGSEDGAWTDGDGSAGAATDGAGEEGGDAGEGAWGEGDDDSIGAEGDEEATQEGPRSAPAARWAKQRAEASRVDLLRATVHRAPAEPAGRRVALTAGTWLLQTESQRGDVAVGYDVRVDVRALLPGVVLSVEAPAVVDVVAPAAAAGGLVRLRTRGATDVACRLFDDKRALVATSHGSGADWNCALAVPLSPGSTHRLFVDAEVLQPGPTTIVAEFLEARDTGPLKDGDGFRLKGKVARATVQAVRGQVTEVTLTSADDFSCAAFDTDGALLDRQVATRRCTLPLWSGESDAPFSVLVWTEDRPASVKAQVGQRAVRSAVGLFAPRADDSAVVEVALASRGRFTTAAGALCRPRQGRGAFLPCADAASFDPTRDGDRILVAVPRGQSATIAFSEVVADVGAAPTAPVERIVDARVAVERARAPKPMLHLADVRALPGPASAPSCALEGGVRSLEPARCTAATGPQTTSVLSLWTAPGGRVPVRLQRHAVALPVARALVPATVVVDAVTRYTLPSEPFRLEAAVAADAWVILLDDAERSVDVCAADVAPRSRGRVRLSRCVLRGRGGSVVVVPGEGPGEARFDLLRFAQVDEPARMLADVREVRPRAPGRERLRFAAASTERTLWLEGRGVRGCAVVLDDGTRLATCTASIPAGQAGDAFVEHDERPWRAALGPRGELPRARFGALPPPTTPALALADGQAEPMGRGIVQRTASTRGPGVLRVRANGGVCGVARVDTADAAVVASEGLGGGCDLSVVADGDASWRLLVRSFGGAPLSGTLVWTFAPAPTLTEGVGPETLVQPGEARAFRVELAADGELGVGLQTEAEVLECALLDSRHAIVADGCQQFGRFAKGTYWLRVKAPADVGARRFRPVVFGLRGAEIEVPDEWLRDFFRRVRPKESEPTATEVR